MIGETTVLWEFSLYIVYIVLVLAAYILVIYFFSEEYMLFLKSRGLRWRNSLVIIMLTAGIIASSSAIVHWYLSIGGSLLTLCILFIITISSAVVGQIYR